VSLFTSSRTGRGSSDSKPTAILARFQSIKLQPISKGHVRSLMRRLFELLALWECLHIARRNAVELIQFQTLIADMVSPKSRSGSRDPTQLSL
jgi:hypothetical protein